MVQWSCKDKSQLTTQQKALQIRAESHSLYSSASDDNSLVLHNSFYLCCTESFENLETFSTVDLCPHAKLPTLKGLKPVSSIWKRTLPILGRAEMD